MLLRSIFFTKHQVAQHLANSYGDRAWAVASLAQATGKRWPVFGKRLSSYYPYIEAEVRYAVRREYACTAVVSDTTYSQSSQFHVVNNAYGI